ncbi:MAG: metallophosphoesterase [Candidatus Pacearchaeota archaeon]|jgi:hypothetical protein
MKIEILEDSILINKEILVFSDIHLGYENSYVGLYPKIQLKEIKDKINRIFDNLNNNIKIKKIIILGDIKNNFSSVTADEWRETVNFFNFLNDKIKNKENIIVIKGNHDIFIEPVLKKIGIKLVESLILDNMLFIHGDKHIKIDNKIKYLFLGHLHPIISLKDAYKIEKFRCFLKGIWNRKQVFILPSFSFLNNGYDIRNIKDEETEFLMIAKKFLLDFEVIIFNEKEDKTYNFGKIKKIK